MRIEMHHADRPAAGDRAEDRQGDRMIAAGGDRRRSRCVDAAKALSISLSCTGQLERLLDPGVADHRRSGRGRRIDAARPG